MMRTGTLAIGNLVTLDMLIEDFQTMTSNRLNRPEFPFLEWISSHSFSVPETLEWIFSPSFPFPNFGKIKFYIGPTSDHCLATKFVSHCSCLELNDVTQKDAEFMQPLLVNVELNCWICKSLTKSLKNVEMNC